MALGATVAAQAAVVDVTVTVNKLAPANGIAFAPLHVGFHGGGFNAFDLGAVASTSIISVAEGGAGGAWQAAFVGNDDLLTPQGSVVAFNFAELAAFNGLATGAGYTFNSGLAAGGEVYRISFAVTPVPEPGSLAMLTAGLLGIGMLARRRRAAAGDAALAAA